MPLLDGKYEIHDERVLVDGVTTFSATAPDGAPVLIEWLDLDPADEAAFERYRRLLKRLNRDGLAAIQDVVARPGARYVAWYLAPDAAPATRDPALEALVAAAGFDPAQAVVRRVDGAPLLVALPFRPPAALPTTQPTEERGAPRPRVRLPAATPQLRAWGLSSALLVVGVGLLFVGLQRRANDRVVVLPEVVGAPYAEAAALLHELGLRVVPQPVAADAEQAGMVLVSDPGAGQTLRPGREVRLTVALPPGQLAPTDVPRVVGLPSTEAAATLLERAGLTLGRSVRIHVDAPIGVLLAQSPVAGERVGRGATVDVVVSLGPREPRTFLPDLVGLDLDDALALATVAGLSLDQVVLERFPSGRAARDEVLAQSLAPYRDVVVADAILRLIVADAPEARDPDTLPALGGLGEAEARAVAAGFDVEVVYVGVGGLPDGVVAQSLAPGARPGDGPLVLTVNTQPLQIPEPRVDVTVRTPTLRELSYLWFIEPGIPTVVAEVTATTLEGERTLVERRQVQGGGRVSGQWWTIYPGVIHFELTLNGETYGGSLRAP